MRVRHLLHHSSGLPATARLLAAAGGLAEEELDNERLLTALGLFTPLGLSSSHLGAPPPGTPDRVRPPATIGDGGWWVSAADLLAWLAALNRDALGADVSRLVQTPGRLDDGTPLNYGWGVTVRRDAARTILTHGGNWPGWTAKTVRCPERGTAVALLTTSDDVAAVSTTAIDLHAELAATSAGDQESPAARPAPSRRQPG